MIEVTVTHPSGLRDEAEADTYEDARLAAQTLYDEMREANPYQGFQKGIQVRVVHVATGAAAMTVGVRP